MKTEMDALKMDERQRVSWLLANRATLVCVGVIWIVLIALQTLQGHTPWFMIAMVPVIALIRFAWYRHYNRTMS